MEIWELIWWYWQSLLLSQNDAPVAVNDNAATNEDIPVNGNVKLNDTDLDGTIVDIDLDPGTPGVQTNFTNAGGSLEYCFR